MARIRRYMGRVEVHLDRRERGGLLHAVTALADGLSGSIDPRLAPRAYDDPALEAEYARWTRPDVVAIRSVDVETIRTDLAAGNDVIRLDEDRALTWLRALNHLRLVAAGRLGIDGADWEERSAGRILESDDYAMLSDLGWVQEGVLECLEDTSA